MLENLRHIYSIRFILYSLNIMALESLSNPLQALASLPYAMNLRSQDATTNNAEWSATTQYFINDVVRSPLTGGLYVYEAWDGAQNLSSAIVSANDPSSVGGQAEGWASAQGNGLKTVDQNSAAVTGVAAGAAGSLGATAGLTLTLLNPIGVASTWLVKLDYNATLTGAGAFAATEWVVWTTTTNGAAPTVRVCNHVFGAGAVGSGSPVSVVVTLPADATTVTVTGVQSATSAVLLFTGGVVATYARLA
jgi:hypothetical protein